MLFQSYYGQFVCLYSRHLWYKNDLKILGRFWDIPIFQIFKYAEILLSAEQTAENWNFFEKAKRLIGHGIWENNLKVLAENVT